MFFSNTSTEVQELKRKRQEVRSGKNNTRRQLTFFKGIILIKDTRVSQKYEVRITGSTW